MNWFHMQLISLFVVLLLLLQMGHCSLVTKFPKDPEKEGRWWINYIKAYRRSCWIPKGHIYMKMANLSIENALIKDELAFYLTTCILEVRGRPALLCGGGSEEEEEEADNSIRNCAKNNAYAWSLFDSFVTKIPLMALVENLEISSSDLERMKTMMTQDDNLLRKDSVNSELPQKPIFTAIRDKMHNYIEQRSIITEWLESVTQFLADAEGGYNALLE